MQSILVFKTVNLILIITKYYIYFKGGMGMPQGNMPGQMQLPPGPNMSGGPGSNQIPGLMQNSTLTASLQNQSQTNLGDLLAILI